MKNKLLLLLTLVVLVAIGVGGYLYYNSKMNTVGFRGVPLSMKGKEEFFRYEWAEKLNEIASKDENLNQFVEEIGYAELMGVAPEDAAEDLKKRLVVKYREDEQYIQFGVTGKVRNNEKLDKISQEYLKICSKALTQTDIDYLEYVSSQSQN